MQGRNSKPITLPGRGILISQLKIQLIYSSSITGQSCIGGTKRSRELTICKWRKQNFHLCETWSMTQCSSLNWYNKSFINIKYSVYRDESSLLILNKKINTVKHWHDDKSLGLPLHYTKRPNLFTWLVNTQYLYHKQIMNI